MWPPLTDDRATTRGDPAAGVQLSSHAVAHHYQVGPRFVQACLEAVASTQLAQRGLSLEEIVLTFSSLKPGRMFAACLHFTTRLG